MNGLWKPAEVMALDFEPVLSGLDHRVIYRVLVVEPQIDGGICMRLCHFTEG